MMNKSIYSVFVFILSLLTASCISAAAFAECPDGIKNVFCPHDISMDSCMDSFITKTNFKCIGNECKKNGISFPQKQVKMENFNDFVEPESDKHIWNNSREAKECVIDALRFIPSSMRTRALIINFNKECKKKAGQDATTIECNHVEKTLCDLFICCNMPKPETICPPDDYDIKKAVNDSKKVNDVDIRQEYQQR